MSVPQWALRGLLVLLPALAFAGEVHAGAAVQTTVVVLLTVSVGLSALAPDSHAPLAVLLVLGIYWAMEVEQQLSVTLLAVAVALVLFHVTCLLASYGPTSVVPDRTLLRLWALRTADALGVAALVWLAARLATGLDPSPSGWLLAAALLLLLGWAVLLGRRLVTDSDVAG